jgi:Cu(I)/Ag(I) efflux system membrane fusion protein
MYQSKFWPILALGFLVASCNRTISSDEKGGSDQSPVENTSSTKVVTGSFNKEIKNTFKNYLTLKNAFVKSDTSLINAATNQLLVSLENPDTAGIGEDYHIWFSSKEKINKLLTAIKESKNLAVQKEKFNSLSDCLFDLLSHYGIPGISVYQNHCPMALDNRGANWLSDKEKIENPYFGDEMLDCGAVVKVLKN